MVLEVIDRLQTIIRQNARRLRVDTSRINELAGIFFGAFGSEFFLNLATKFDPFSGEREMRHPLIKGLLQANAPELAISELLEIALYLKEFANDPSIGEIVKRLKDSSEYESVLLQLAMAYRLKRILPDVHLEPSTLHGKADIGFSHDGIKYVGECYRINKSFDDYFFKFEQDLAKVLFRLVPSGKKYSFICHINSLLTFDGMRAIAKRFRELFEELQKTPDLVRLDVKFREHILGVEDLSVFSKDPDFDGDDIRTEKRVRYLNADSAIFTSMVRADSIFGALDNPRTTQERTNRLFLWKGFKEPRKKGVYSNLSDKLARKLKQIKVDDSSVRRVLFVELPFSFGISKNAPQHKEIQNTLTRNFSNLSGILLTERRPEAHNRFGYRGVVIQGYQQNAFPTELLDKINQVELSDLFLRE